MSVDPNALLIIDDDDAIVRILTHLLESAGYRVYSAAQARRGLAMAMQIRPRAILLDYMLPEKDGLSVLADMRRVPELEHVPIIMITAAGTGEVVREAIRNHVTDFLAKPFSRSMLLERVTRWAPLVKGLRLGVEPDLAAISETPDEFLGGAAAQAGLADELPAAEAAQPEADPAAETALVGEPAPADPVSADGDQPPADLAAAGPSETEQPVSD